MTPSIAWILPVTFIPGLAILIMSTINKRTHVYDIVTNRMDRKDPELVPVIKIHLRRLRFIHLALTMLYSGIGSLALASLTGGLTSEWVEISAYLVVGLIVLGLIFLSIAVGFLIYESSLSTKALLKERFFQHEMMREIM